MIVRVILTVAEVSEMTGLTLPTVRSLARKGKIPAVRVGHKYLFHRDTLLQFLSATPSPPPPSREEVTGGNGMD